MREINPSSPLNSDKCDRRKYLRQNQSDTVGNFEPATPTEHKLMSLSAPLRLCAKYRTLRGCLRSYLLYKSLFDFAPLAPQLARS
ncbi:MAG: hypothetical protein AAFY63_13510, partial [Cyanobacteria bacterium J06643_13]